MSRFHPSWPSPLLALDPIRLRPMGWLDDLLPMRPPSLWRDRSLYARALRWQPDMADLSWLFDAYAMLGIEMPPPRIEHRTHQRSPQRGRLKGGSRQTQLRRRRAPIKGGKRPLAIPRWSSPPQMIAPTKGDTQKRVDIAPAFRTRRTIPTNDVQPSLVRSPSSLERVQPKNLAKVQWRSPERTAPAPTLGRTSAESIVPPIGAQPTLLRKEESPQSITPERGSTPAAQKDSQPRSIVEKVVAKSKRPIEVLAPRKPKVERYPALDTVQPRQRRKNLEKTVDQAPPPKVTWQRGHTRSPWRLNQSGRTLFKPSSNAQGIRKPQTSELQNQSASSLENTSATPVQRRLSEQITRIGQQRKGLASLAVQTPLQPRSTGGVTNEAIDWSPVRKGVIRDAVLEQGKVRAIVPAVQMELPPSLNRETVSESSKQKPSGAQSRTASVESTRKSISDRTSAEAQRGVGRAASVRVPTRVPWRLKPSSAEQTIKNNRSIVPDPSSADVVKRSATPIAQQIEPSRNRIRARIPEVRSWYPPKRQQLIEHFQNKRIERARIEREAILSRPYRSRDEEVVVPTTRKQSSDRAKSSPTIRPMYSFASPLQAQRTLLAMSESTDSQQTIRNQKQPVSEQAAEGRAPTLRQEEGAGSKLRKSSAARGASSSVVFRAQEQSMVAPLHAGTLVFPTPSVATEIKSSSSKVQSADTDPVQKTPVQSLSSVERKSKASIAKVKSTTQTVPSRTYPKSFVQQRDTYQRQSKSTDSVFWRMPKSTSSRQEVVSPLLRTIAERSVELRWRLPKVVVSDGSLTAKRTLNRSQNVRSSTVASKSVFRAPTTFWQGSFSQRGSIQLPSPMVYTTPSEDVSGKQQAKQSQKTQAKITSERQNLQTPAKQSTDWIPKQVLRVNETTRSKPARSEAIPTTERARRSRGASRDTTPVRSVSWTRKPSFPDPFAAQHKAVQSSSAQVTPRTKSSPVAAQTSKVSTGLLRPDASTHPNAIRKAQTDNVPVFSDRDRSAIGSRRPDGNAGQRTGLGTPKSVVAPVRRVVAPTLSASLVYRSPSVDTDISTRSVSKGKYASEGSASGRVERLASGATRVPSPKPVGKYASTRTETESQLRLDVGTEQVADAVSGKIKPPSDLIGPAKESSVSTVVEAEAVVEKTVRKLVRRLPSTQQSLLRSKIALPTNWARKLGLAPTAEVKLGWKLQRSLTGEGSVGSAVSMAPNLSPMKSTQLVVPNESEVEKPMSVSSSKDKLASEARSQSNKPMASVASNPAKSRKLSNAQINRIIERQVSFFRSAQRQSFLKVAQMTDEVSPTAKPAQARGGLQQVTGEMRKALQRMVFSSDAQPVFLDATSDVDRQSERIVAQKPTTTQTSVSAPTASKERPKTRRLGMRSPQWRPGIHTPAPAPKYGRRQQSSTETTRNVATRQTPIQTTAQSTPTMMPQSAPMTMLQTEESQDQAISRSTESNSVDQPTKTTGRSTTGAPKPQQIRPKSVHGRSTTVAPMSLMGRSDVGVFLQPKRKVAEPEVSISKPAPQKADSVDSDSDVFMIDPSGNLLTGKQATKRLKELGFARSETNKPNSKPQMDASSGSYTWEAPADLMQEAVKQVRQQMVVEEKIKETSSQQTRPVRQSVIKEWTEEQLLTILVELASSSPEANALLRDVQERVEEYFDLERFRKI